MAKPYMEGMMRLKPILCLGAMGSLLASPLFHGPMLGVQDLKFTAHLCEFSGKHVFLVAPEAHILNKARDPELNPGPPTTP